MELILIHETQSTLPGASPLTINWSVGPSFLSLGPNLPTLVPPFFPFQLDSYFQPLDSKPRSVTETKNSSVTETKIQKEG